MTALVGAFSRISTTTTELKVVGLFCGAGLIASLMLAIYGLDLSPGFF